MPDESLPRLVWPGKERSPEKSTVRLREVPGNPCAPKHLSDPSSNEPQNQLIFGDNASVLTALAARWQNTVKCIYIDPPYNTGASFEHYRDVQKHARWLTMMRQQLVKLYDLLRHDGFLCCHIDDSEGQYLKVLLDEIFGREHYLSTIYVRVRHPAKTLKQDMAFHKEIEQIHVYRKSAAAEPNLQRRPPSLEKFCHYIKEQGPGRELKLGNKRVTVFGKREFEIVRGEPTVDGLKQIWASGTILDGNTSGRFFRDYLTGRSSLDGLGVLYKVYGMGDDQLPFRYFTGPKRSGATKGKYYQGVPQTHLEQLRGLPTPIHNFHDLAASFGNCRSEGGVDFRSGKKPEKLLQILLEHFSSADELVMDTYAGSGTTGAVAHKLGRRWIMIEQGEQCQTHCYPRMQAVVKGEDPTGITNEVGWQGGGGFRYFLASPVIG